MRRRNGSMLRIIQNSTAVGAKSYYSTADYYSEGQELVGQWKGRGAKLLGLSGNVEKRDWDALCDNLDPRTGATLTSRQPASRRIGYDINFHPPKSYSLLYELTDDPRLLSAFKDAVDATMQEMEAEMETRVRHSGRNEDRTTGNMVWGEYIHHTSRPVDGFPDPQLHAHCFTFNTTFDSEEGRWKAGQFAGLKRDARFFEAMFHSRLSHAASQLGLPVVRTKQGWELAGLDRTTLAKFSRRTQAIEAKAAAKGITDPVQKSALGVLTRAGKSKELSMPELRRLWADRLDATESDALQRLAEAIGTEPEKPDPSRAERSATHAVDHCFERSAVVPERVLAATALRHGYGQAHPTQIHTALAAKPLIRAQHRGRDCVTTQEVLAEERGMIEFARKGRGSLPPIAAGPHRFSRDWLGPDQKAAVEHVLHAYDRVVSIRGGAGTGKTSLMQEADEGIRAAGLQVYAFAPSAAASRSVLRDEGFASADTVARLLVDEKLQNKLRGQVMWVDEAGLLSSRTMAQLFKLADLLDVRIVLSGDRGQHGSVA